MKTLRYGLWATIILACGFAALILFTPTAQFKMVLTLRSGHTADPGKWLVVLPLVIIGINLWSLRDLRRDPQASPTFKKDWTPLIAELVLMGLLVFEQFA